MTNFIDIFKERGFFHQCTDEEAVSKLNNITAYIGFDLTADSLHVGSLLQIMILRRLKAEGHTPIVLLGGATTKVGDPSGKDESRPVITDETIAKNKAGIAKIFDQFGLGDCKIVDNSEWLEKLNYLELLRDYGRLFSVNRMIAKESVKQRLDRDSEMSFLEFNYMIFQAYDFAELAKNYNCNLQIGGSDQWGNITEGIDLYRRLNAEDGKKRDENVKIFGLTTPLITTADGKKMGKTADGAMWLSADKLSPYDYYQFWRNTGDADVIKFLKFFTELSVAEIDEMKKWEGSADINEAKKILAFEATKLCHGEDEATKAAAAAVEAFEKGGSEGLPEVKIEAREYKAFELFASAGLAESNGKARKLIQGGGARIDDEKIADENQLINIADGTKLSSGKKKHLIVRTK